MLPWASVSVPSGLGWSMATVVRSEECASTTRHARLFGSVDGEGRSVGDAVATWCSSLLRDVMEISFFETWGLTIELLVDENRCH